MATVPGYLIWQIVKKNNFFLVQQFGRGNAGVRFSKEPNNLYNLHSYKHSCKVWRTRRLTIQAGGNDQSVVLATTKTNKPNKPDNNRSDHVVYELQLKPDMGYNEESIKHVLVADNFYKPDLKRDALSSVHKSLRVSKSGVKKRNMQASRIYGRK